MNEFLNLETFVRVADTGSFTAAADALQVRQPTVSRRIAELEGALGAALLVRSTRTLTLTEAGQRYLERARAVLASMAHARDAVRADGPLSGVLRVAAPVSLAAVWLGALLTDFLSQHPALHVELELSEQHVDLVAAHVDLALRVGGPDSAGLVGRRLRRVERWLVASPDWLEQNGPVHTIEDLRQHTGLIYAPPGRPQRRWPLLPDPVEPRRVISATSGLVLQQLALAGAGIAMLPDWIVTADLDGGRLVRLLPDVHAQPLEMWVVWPAHRYQRAAARAFVRWILVAGVSPGRSA